MTFMYVCVGVGALIIAGAIATKVLLEAVAIKEKHKRELDDQAERAMVRSLNRQLIDIQTRKFAPQISRINRTK